MKKSLLLVFIILPLFAVNAQTFRRKPQKPTFFMPKTAVTSQQQERLPSVESMNYNGQYPTVYDTKPAIEQKTITRPKSVSDNQNIEPATNRQAQNNQISQPAKVQEKKSITRTRKTQNDTAEKKPENQVTASNSDKTYQKIFEQIFNRHRADLMRISNGDYSQANDITELVDSFKPGARTVKDTVYPRSVIIQ